MEFPVHREVPGKFESRNLGRDNLSTEIGRKPQSQQQSPLGGRLAHGVDTVLSGVSTLRYVALDHVTSHCMASYLLKAHSVALRP